jgi:hypothetical protein
MLLGHPLRFVLMIYFIYLLLLVENPLISPEQQEVELATELESFLAQVGDVGYFG